MKACFRRGVEATRPEPPLWRVKLACLRLNVLEVCRASCPCHLQLLPYILG